MPDLGELERKGTGLDVMSTPEFALLFLFFQPLRSMLKGIVNTATQ